VLVQLGLAAEVLETDIGIAEALLLAGDAPGAQALAVDAAARAEGLGAGYLLPTLQRLQGAALADAGRLHDARLVLDEALRSCELQGRIESGFVLAELSRVARDLGDDGAGAELAARSERALDELGFVGSPRYPRGS
jgi:hypothetical protein